MTYNDFWSYHHAPVEPIRPTSERIFGLELEIDRPNAQIEDIIDMMIDEEILGSPNNGGASQINVQISEDGSVWAELVFQAGYKEDILNSLDTLNEYGLNETTAPNMTGGTSAHISISNEYLNRIGVTKTNINRIFELYSPLLFAISERNKEEARRWSNSLAYDFGFIDYIIKLQKVARVNPEYSDRYLLLNTTSRYKSELRILSNNNGGFNYDRIKFYLDVVDKIISQAHYMRGRRYDSQYLYLLEDMERFILKNHPEYYIRYNLKFIFHPSAVYDAFKMQVSEGLHNLKEINKIQNRINRSGGRNTCDIMKGIQLIYNSSIDMPVILSKDGVLQGLEEFKEQYYINMKSYGFQFLRFINYNIDGGF